MTDQFQKENLEFSPLVKYLVNIIKLITNNSNY